MELGAPKGDAARLGCRECLTGSGGDEKALFFSTVEQTSAAILDESGAYNQCEHAVHPKESAMSEAGFRIRVDDELRRDFIETCKSEDLTASQVLRAYMRSYIELHGTSHPTSKLNTAPKRRRISAGVPSDRQ